MSSPRSLSSERIERKEPAFINYHLGLEGLVGGLAHNPYLIRNWEKKMRNGYYWRISKWGFAIPAGLFGFKFSEFRWHFIGVSHLDAAWLWPVLDTKIRALKTFAQAIENIQRFPFFTMSMTTPQYFQWVKDYAPGLWDLVKSAVAKGRIELTGGCWIEPDLDMPWGESLVRQRLYGQLFYLREFGKIATIESLSDVFGFAYSIPQILVKSGARGFWTTKCFWNDENPWPFAVYEWEGVDGSRIFTYQFRFNWFSLPNMKEYRQAGRLCKPHNAQTILSSHNTNAEIEACLSAEILKDFGFFYGWGDGGKGPDRVEVGGTQMLAQLGYGKHTNTEKFFALLHKQVGDRYLIWKDEMYLETHRGTKTSVNEIKHYNRRAEFWASVIEILQSLINAYQPGAVPFEKKHVFEMWRKVMFNQFHDILPGSAIPDVYLLAFEELKKAISFAQGAVQHCLAGVPHANNNLVVFNPFSWERSEYCLVEDKVCFFDKIPPLSIHVVPRVECETQTIQVEGDAYVLENDYMRVRVHKNHGSVQSIYFKATNMELVDPSQSYDKAGCGLRVFRDYPKQYRAWNIDRNYPTHRVPVRVADAPKITTVQHPVSGITTKYSYLKSSATISIFLRPRDKVLHISITTDNRDPLLLVKYFFPLSLKSEWVTSEIPYGSIARKRVKITEREKAKWEMNMQKWVDISDPDIGVAILNNNRYGFNATARGIYITLTRTAKHPPPKFHSAHLLIPRKDRPTYMDLKPFTFELGVLPHVGTWQEGEVVQASYNFNFPLIVGEPVKGKSTLKGVKWDVLAKPFVEIDSSSVILSSIKPSEWSGRNGEILSNHADWTWNQSLILRFVEQHGQAGRVNLRFNSGLVIAKIEEVDLLEMHPSNPLAIQQNQVGVSFTPFEIKTLRIWFS